MSARYLVASLALCGCDGPGTTTSDATTTDADGLTETSDTTEVTPEVANACLVDVPCVIDDDCAPGTRCNLALPEPECQTIRCGAAGTACSDDALCATGLGCDRQVAVCGLPTATQDGAYLMGAHIVLADGETVVFALSYSTANGATTATIQPVSQLTSQPVGETYEATSASQTDQLLFEFGQIEIPEEANPLVRSAMRVVLSLQSRCVEGAGCLCGDLYGEIVSPFVHSLSGSTWGTIEAQAGTPISEVPNSCP